MSQQTNGKSAVATVVDGKPQLVQVPDLVVAANRIAGFVQQFKSEYFEDHGLDWCLDEIVTRGMAEIRRQVKTAKKTRENKVSGDLLRAYNLSPAEANKLLAKLIAEQRAAEEAAKSKPTA